MQISRPYLGQYTNSRGSSSNSMVRYTHVTFPGPFHCLPEIIYERRYPESSVEKADYPCRFGSFAKFSPFQKGSHQRSWPVSSSEKKIKAPKHSDTYVYCPDPWDAFVFSTGLLTQKGNCEYRLQAMHLAENVQSGMGGHKGRALLVVVCP